ncbi:MAG TPA: hypothetical protein VLW54_10955 [Candidatus Acidoferrales bacterium]|nr:hypothetical protein [Candidatus Acidoferrales bacterium]
MSVPRAVPRVLLAGLGLLVLTLFVPSAKADEIYLDFNCSGLACAGSVSQSGGNFSTTGITLTAGPGSPLSGDNFLLVFDTSTGNISLTGLGAASGENFVGTITSFQPSTFGTTTDLNFGAIWPAIPADVQAFFDAPEGGDSGFTIFLTSSGTDTSTDITITPAPEPGGTALMLAGLLSLGLYWKRTAGAVV